MLEWLFVVAFVVVIFGAGPFIFWADRRRVCRMIVAHTGGEIVSVASVEPSMVRHLLSERNTTFWRVTYRTRQGEMRRADCVASFFRCKVYDDQPLD